MKILPPLALALVFLLSAASPAFATAHDCFTYGPLFQQWDGHSWAVSPTLHQWNEGDDLFDVAAVSPDDVWAVGDWANCST